MIRTIQTSAGGVQLVPQAVLEQPDLNIFSANSMTLVVGPNGAGKTRLLASMIKSVLNPDGKGQPLADHSDTLVVYYSPVPCSIPLKFHSERFIDLQNSMFIKRGKREPNLDVLRNLAPAFDVKADVFIRFFATDHVYREVNFLLASRVNPVTNSSNNSLRDAISNYEETRAASQLSRDASGTLAYLDSSARAAEDDARKALGRAIEKFLAKQLGESYRRNILAAAFTIGKHNKPAEFMRSLLQEHGIVFSKPVTKLKAAQKTYDAANDELAAIGTILGDKNLAKSEYVLNEDQVAAITALNYKKFSALSIDPLSSGGTALLTQFSAMDESIKRVMSRAHDFRHLLLLIDEGDIFLHTAWQQKYVLYLNRYVESLRRDGFDDVQLVLTTHSPVLMSDFPRDCIVKLDPTNDAMDDPLDDSPINLRDRHGVVSFGAPLSAIVNTTGEAGTMGTFAVQHIKSVLSRLRDNKPVAQYHIDIIDDPFVRKYIENLQSERI